MHNSLIHLAFQKKKNSIPLEPSVRPIFGKIIPEHAKIRHIIIGTDDTLTIIVEHFNKHIISNQPKKKGFVKGIVLTEPRPQACAAMARGTAEKRGKSLVPRKTS